MKAWIELESNPDRHLYTTSTSKWWLDNGIKIEKFNVSGRIKITNYLTPGDDSETVRGKDLDVFREFGWNAGMYHMCINHQKQLLRQASGNLEDSRGPRERIRRQNRYDAILYKLDDFERKYKQALKNH